MTEEAQARDDGADEQAVRVAGIGASAGGLEALSNLLDALPDEPGAALVVVQHMAPQHESILPELLSRHSRIPVMRAEDRVRVQPDQVYVIPPGVDMTISQGHLGLFERPEGTNRQFVIDRFFVSLAQDLGERAIGVVLSGVGSDGTAGLATIKSAGGVTMAQDPSSAGFDGMPRSAIDADAADIVAEPAQIAAEIARLARLGPPGPEDADRTAVEAPSDDSMRSILASLHRAFNVDFTGYKEGTLKRRIERRMILQRVDSREEYAQLVARDPHELEELYHDVLVMVTGFFREPRSYEALAQTVIPRIVEWCEGEEAELRLWVPGCASGEEPYSLAMLIAEALHGRRRRPRVKILATDINERELAKARSGLYSDERVAPLSSELRERYLTSADGVHRVVDQLRDMCVFSHHDVTRDPPFSRLHLVVCRNLLIYLGQALQERVLSLFHYALVPGGFLALGISESVGDSDDLFETLDQNNRIYAKQGSASNQIRFLPPVAPGQRREPLVERPEAADVDVAYPDPLRQAADALLSGFTPPAVVVDAGLAIVQFFGDTEPFLEHALGRASLNLMAMAREGLEAPLRELVERARAEQSAQAERGAAVHTQAGVRFVDLQALPLAGAPDEDYVLVIFHEAVERGRAAAPEPSADERREIDALRRERAATKSYVQTLLRQKDRINEELRVANEEAQSTNEELQSINEELETAKEEVQSTNEELRTVNEELELRNRELTAAYDDLRNLLESMSVPTIIVDRDLAIRRSTPGTERFLPVVESDIGRPITDLANRLSLSDLGELLESVMQDNGTLQREVRDENGRWFELRVRPFQDRDGRNDGAVLTFVDITDLHRNLEELRTATLHGDSIQRVLTRLTTDPWQPGTIATILEEAVTTLQADSATILLQEGGDWVTVDDYRQPPAGSAAARFQAMIVPHALLAAEADTPITVNLVSVPGTHEAAVVRELGLGSVLVVPLRRMETSGHGVVLFAWKTTSQALTQDQTEYAVKISSLIALTIESRRLTALLAKADAPSD